MTEHDDKKPTKDTPDGEKLAEEIERLSQVSPTAGDGRGEPGDGSAGATGPGGSSS